MFRRKRKQSCSPHLSPPFPPSLPLLLSVSHPLSMTSLFPHLSLPLSVWLSSSDLHPIAGTRRVRARLAPTGRHTFHILSNRGGRLRAGQTRRYANVTLSGASVSIVGVSVHPSLISSGGKSEGRSTFTSAWCVHTAQVSHRVCKPHLTGSSPCPKHPPTTTTTPPQVMKDRICGRAAHPGGLATPSSIRLNS